MASTVAVAESSVGSGSSVADVTDAVLSSGPGDSVSGTSSTMSSIDAGAGGERHRVHVIGPAPVHPGGSVATVGAGGDRLGQHDAVGVGRALVGDGERCRRSCRRAARRSAAAVLVTARSAAWTTSTSTDAESSVRSGSSTSDVTEAVLVTGRRRRPTAPSRAIVIARVVPAATRAEGAHDVATAEAHAASDPAAENTSGAGSRSVSTTSVASDGPVFVTVTVNVMPPPAAGRGDCRRPS